jgi:hypothetical protein
MLIVAIFALPMPTSAFSGACMRASLTNCGIPPRTFLPDALDASLGAAAGVALDAALGDALGAVLPLVFPVEAQPTMPSTRASAASKLTILFI